MMKDLFYKISAGLLDAVRVTASAHEEQALLEEKLLSIEKTTLAMCEADVKDEVIIKMLQKYWDLRLSEANEFLIGAKEHLNKK